MAPSKRNYGDTIEALKDIIKESLQNPERKQEFVNEGSVELIIGKEDLLLRVSNGFLKYGYQLLNAQLEFCLYFFFICMRVFKQLDNCSGRQKINKHRTLCKA